MSAIGPSLLTWALQQPVRFQRDTGCAADVAATVESDPELTSSRFISTSRPQPGSPSTVKGSPCRSETQGQPHTPKVTTVISGGTPTRIGTIEQPSPPDTKRCRAAASLLPAVLPLVSLMWP